MSDPGKPEILTPAPQEPGEPEQVVAQPAKLIRIASMIRELMEEVRQIKLDEGARDRLTGIYRQSVDELREALSDDLERELMGFAAPLESGSSESEIRVAQAQLLGWLEGLFHGIQAALWAQHMQAQAAMQEMRRRGLPSGMQVRPPEGRPPTEASGAPGQYL